MLSKLSFRNAKRQANDYLIYFVTIILVCAMLYAFNALIFSKEIQELFSYMDSLLLIIVLSSIVVVFIIGWLVSYTTGFMLSRRSRELGTYLLMGMENSQVAGLFFRENLMVGGVAMMLGIPLGNLLFQALRVILLTMFARAYHFNFAFSLHAACLTLAYFAGIYLFALGRSRKRIRRMKIYDLIYFERKNEDTIVKKNSTRRTMFTVSLILGLLGTLLLTMAGSLPIGILGAGCIIAFLYCFFISFSSGIPAFFDRHPERKYQGQTLLIFRTLTAKLATMGMTMATIALLFAATLLTEGAGMVFNGIFQGRTERDSFDLLYTTGSRENMDICLDYVKENIPLTAFRQYNLYQTDNAPFTDYLCANTEYYRAETLSGVPCEYDFLMAESDYAALRAMLGYPAVKLQPGTYLIHCMPYLQDLAAQWDQPLLLNGKALFPDIVCTEQFTQNLWDGNGRHFILVAPDEACTGRPVYSVALAAMTEKPLSKEQYDELDSRLNGPLDGQYSSSAHSATLYSKSLSLQEAASFSAITVFPLFYLALTLAMTAATVLTVWQLSETGRCRRQFGLLYKLGMDRREMMRALLLQFAIYYAMPAVPPVLIAIPFILKLANAVEPGTMVGMSSPPVILAVSLGLFFLIYLIYIVIAVKSFYGAVQGPGYTGDYIL